MNRPAAVMIAFAVLATAPLHSTPAAVVTTTYPVCGGWSCAADQSFDVTTDGALGAAVEVSST